LNYNNLHENSQGDAMKKFFIAVIATVPFCLAPALAAPPVDPMFDWTGFYAGGHVGYGSLTIFAPPGSSYIPKPTGGLAGGQVGANYEFAPHWVVGTEIDGAFARIEDSKRGPDPNFPATLLANTVKVNWTSSVRGRFGYSMNQTLIYVTGGFAWAGHELTSSTSNFTPGVPRTAVSQRVLEGWTIGGGIERFLWSNWTGRIEYLFMHGQPITYASAGTDPNPTARSDEHIVRISVNWLFR
jgi:outer membrane immunogenic protein